ncbi:Uncharacterised protein [Mesomycoplasma conjunctivae]|nr:Uncharacterised protein [Mesomycoplasma conjunctivae]
METSKNKIYKYVGWVHPSSYIFVFIWLVVLKTIIFRLKQHIINNKFYENYLLTEVSLVAMLQKLVQRVEFNTSNQQMMFKNRGCVSSDPDIWNKYNFYFDILINQ